ncbi:hypothetical protein PYW07_009265 [Mythimna separata]|uniref:Uncharacterized protein n=1 Tax=Mythimna separata TaxID=271217 RepID=A0AAD7YBN8_MYTSE|nr:hypothetical protein PYW07_009265 [Mythimna separata]
MLKIKRSLWLLFLLAVGVTARPDSASTIELLDSAPDSTELLRSGHVLESASQESSDETAESTAEDSDSDESRMFHPEELLSFEPVHRCNSAGDMYYEKRNNICYVCACFTTSGLLYSKCAACNLCFLEQQQAVPLPPPPQFIPIPPPPIPQPPPPPPTQTAVEVEVIVPPVPPPIPAPGNMES